MFTLSIDHDQYYLSASDKFAQDLLSKQKKKSPIVYAKKVGNGRFTYDSIWEV